MFVNPFGNKSKFSRAEARQASKAKSTGVIHITRPATHESRRYVKVDDPGQLHVKPELRMQHERVAHGPWCERDKHRKRYVERVHAGHRSGSGSSAARYLKAAGRKAYRGPANAGWVNPRKSRRFTKK